MDQTTQSSTGTAFVPPANMEEAKARLEEVKFKKKDLSLQKKDVMEQQRQRRAEYTENERNRATWGKGAGGPSARISARPPGRGQTSSIPTVASRWPKTWSR